MEGRLKYARTFLAAMAATTLIGFGSSRAETEAIVDWVPGAEAAQCEEPQHAFRLTIADGGRRILTMHYCSAHGRSGTSVVEDACGRRYVFLGTSAGPGLEYEDFMTIYRLTDRLVERARLQVAGNANLHLRWFYAFRIEKPPEGGLRLRFSLRMEGDEAPVPELTPARTRIVRIREPGGCEGPAVGSGPGEALTSAA